jgi:hypothetical protein
MLPTVNALDGLYRSVTLLKQAFHQVRRASWLHTHLFKYWWEGHVAQMGGKQTYTELGGETSWQSVKWKVERRWRWLRNEQWRSVTLNRKHRCFC